MMASMTSYALEQLFVDQDPNIVADTIAPVLAWVPGTSKKLAAMPFTFQVEPSALRGVEVAGRGKGGVSKLREIRDGSPKTKNRPAVLGKAAQLKARVDVKEAYSSLFCASPRVALKERVKP